MAPLGGEEFAEGDHVKSDGRRCITIRSRSSPAAEFVVVLLAFIALSPMT
jgi:hypothetical protein